MYVQVWSLSLPPLRLPLPFSREPAAQVCTCSIAEPVGPMELLLAIPFVQLAYPAPPPSGSGTIIFTLDLIAATRHTYSPHSTSRCGSKDRHHHRHCTYGHGRGSTESMYACVCMYVCVCVCVYVCMCVCVCNMYVMPEGCACRAALGQVWGWPGRGGHSTCVSG